MADSPTYGTGLADKLRVLIKDTAYQYPQLRVGVPAGGVITTATLEVVDDSISVFLNGTESLIDLSPESDDAETIEKLVPVLQDIHASLQVGLVGDGDPHHASLALQPIPPTNIYSTSVLLYTRKWSDADLQSAIDRAVERHNFRVPVSLSAPIWTGNYTAVTVPSNHHQFILTLAHIEVLKMMAQDVARRRNTDVSVSDWNTLISVLETSYNSDMLAYLESLDRRADTEVETEELGSGDVILGNLYREAGFYSARRSASRASGYGAQRTPGAVLPSPPTPTLTATALGSGAVKLSWSRNRDTSFGKYELWRGTTASVSNESDFAQPSGSLVATGEKIRTEASQHQVIWVDGALAPLPAGTYYYRLYTFNRNNLFSGSSVVSVSVT